MMMTRLAGRMQNSFESGEVENEAEADMGGAAVGRGTGTGGDPIAMAIGAVAEMRAALEQAQVLGSRCLVAFLGATGERTDMEWVGAPFPGVAGHVVEAEAVGRESIDRGSRGEAVGRSVVGAEATLPDIAGKKVLVVGLAIAPGIASVLQSAGCGAFPFGFARQATAGPGSERVRISPGDLYHRMARWRGRGGAVRRSPAGTLDAMPPGWTIYARQRRLVTVKHQRPAKTFGLGAV